MNEQDIGTRMFRPWARRVIGVVSILCGLVLAFSALDKSSPRLGLSSAVCFAIAAANLLPPHIGKWFSRAVAVVMVAMSANLAIDSLDGTTEDKYSALKFGLLLGLPSLWYLSTGGLPFNFGGKRPR